MKTISLFLLLLLFVLSSVSASHFILGRVNDALDGTSANGELVVLWNVTSGQNDNVSDTIGPTGNSGQNNIYMIDCELLSIPCEVGNNLSIQVVDSGSGYVSSPTYVTVTGAGFDLASNLTLNSPPNITSFIVEDALTLPVNEIDLVAASNRSVTCTATVDELDSDGFQNAYAELYSTSLSSQGDSDDHNYHYTNSSCFTNTSYGGPDEVEVTCGFAVSYYAEPGSWECFFSIDDTLNHSSNATDATFVNQLLSIGVVDAIDFGVVDTLAVSNESVLNVTNYGNVRVNLSLSGYGATEGDGLAMNCSAGPGINVSYLKYNLSSTTSGDLTLPLFESLYDNLTSSPVIRNFPMSPRQDDSSNDAINSTYWRIYVPLDVALACEGNIVFGASLAAGT